MMRMCIDCIPVTLLLFATSIAACETGGGAAETETDGAAENSPIQL